ncbi:MAG: MarR family transcriptional regulator [Rhizobiaceae bacterium]|nr:MarR family transcriptional regulator [Rhizobiaceae bacterium]MBL4731928.1 MarR family transcriptional regulator [Rhizobiaceae bacterium]
MDQIIAPVITVDQVDVGPLHGNLGFLLRMAQLQVYEDFYADLGEYGLKPGEFSVLTLIYKNPHIRQGVLARRLMIKRAHMTKLIRVFEDRGHVSRTIPDEDRRAVELELTADGLKFVETNWDRFYGHEKAQTPRLTPAEEKQMLGLLRKFVDLEQGDAQ